MCSHIFPGYSVARQWFGSLAKPLSPREYWLAPAAAEFLSLLAIQSTASEKYSLNLVKRRDSLYTLFENDRDRPLGTGGRIDMTLQSNRGVWLFHMLRFMMYDFENKSEKKFNKFLWELSMLCNTKCFSNSDLIKLAERHYGEPLDWFFKQWLYSFGYPEFKVEYTIHNREGGYYLTGKVLTEGVDPDFKMPVILRVKGKNGESQFMREMIEGVEHEMDLGWIDFEPEELVFNEFYSVLSKDKVKKK